MTDCALLYSLYATLRKNVDINVNDRLRTSTHCNESIIAVASLLGAFSSKRSSKALWFSTSCRRWLLLVFLDSSVTHSQSYFIRFRCQLCRFRTHSNGDDGRKERCRGSVCLQARHQWQLVRTGLFINGQYIRHAKMHRFNMLLKTGTKQVLVLQLTTFNIVGYSLRD